MSTFRCKQFSLEQTGVAHRVGTDSLLLGAWTEPADAQNVLDIGTGTGVLALMLAQRTTQARIDAVDLHPPSVLCAAGNFAASPWAGRLQVFESPVQQFAPPDGRQYDLVVSNPPFFSSKTVSPDESRRLARSTSALPIPELLAAAQRLLAPNGRFCVVMPVAEAQQLAEMAVLQGLFWTRVTTVYTRPGKPVERWLLQLERTPHPIRRDALWIHDSNGDYSAEYRALTRDFYLNF